MESKIDIDKMILIVGGGIASYTKLLRTKHKDTYIPPTEKEVIQDYLHNPVFNRVVDCIIANIKDHITKQST